MPLLEDAKTSQEVQQFLDTHGGVAVVDCYATWCGPCKAIAPYVKKKNTETGIPLITVNVDETDELTQAFKVAAMPTFVVIKDKWNNVITTVVGGGPGNVDKVYDAASKNK